MVAQLQRAAVFAAWLGAALSLAAGAAVDRWLLGIFGAVALLTLQPIALAVEFFALLPWHNRRDATPRASLMQLVQAWWRESLTAHDTFARQQPFHAWREPDAPDAPAGRRGVVLVHGFFCNRAVWNHWMPALRAAGVPYVAVDLEPPFAGIDAYADTIERAIARLHTSTGMPPLVVAHSMGGMAVRAWWRAHGDEAAARVDHVVTIGTPHRGTFVARLSRAPNARQMVPGSAWLRALEADEGDGRARHFTCFFSHCDNIVLPASHAALPGADNRHVEGEPHVALIHAPAVWHFAMQRLGVGAAEPPRPPVNPARAA